MTGMITVFYCKIIHEIKGESHRLLAKATRRLYGEGDYDLAVQPDGKPYFLHHPDIHFSISHSGEYWTCAFADAEIGLDIQIEDYHRKKEKIAKRFFSPGEQVYLEAYDYEEFYDIWAMKEAYLKYIGEGLARGLDKISVVKEGQIADVVCSEGERNSEPGKTGYLQKIDFQSGYHMWICTDLSNRSIEIRKRELT